MRPQARFRAQAEDRVLPRRTTLRDEEPFYPSALYRLLARINAYLVRWIRNKYRRYDATRAARRKLAEITSEYPRLFRHWRWVTTAY